MGTISKLPLSGSSQGKSIQISATSSLGTTVHVTGASSTIVDEIWIYCTNNGSVAADITIEYGGTGAANQVIATIQSKSGLTILLAGLVLTGTGSVGTTITAFASTTNVINVLGYINRITP